MSITKHFQIKFLPMARKHIPHRGSSAWKRDILLLTYILRLCTAPQVPYSVIAPLLLQHFSSSILKLYEKCTPKATRESGTLDGKNKGLESWLVKYLEERFDYAEQWMSNTWQSATGFDRIIVREIMRVSGLLKMGYEVVDEAEMRLQIKWRRGGDWRAGSTPERQEWGGNTNSFWSPVGSPPQVWNIIGENPRIVSTAAHQQGRVEEEIPGMAMSHLEQPRKIQEGRCMIQVQQQSPEVCHVRSTLFEPTIGIRIGLDTVEEAATPFRYPASSGSSQFTYGCQLQSCWNSFATQLAEIKAVQEVLREKQMEVEYFETSETSNGEGGEGFDEMGTPKG